MPSLGVPELIIILVIIVVIFGAGRLPEIGGAIGKSIKEFKNSVNDGQSKDKSIASKDDTSKDDTNDEA